MNFKLFKCPEYVLKIKTLVTSNKVGDWCRIPYIGHPKGCPNYGRENCPPKAKNVGEVFDTKSSLYFVYSDFDLSKHIDKMKELHSDWSDRQCRCVLYWQSSNRKELKRRILTANIALGTDCYTLIPEAMGVNVYVTAGLSGLKLERIRDLKTCHHIALIGFRR